MLAWKNLKRSQDFKKRDKNVLWYLQEALPGNSMYTDYFSYNERNLRTYFQGSSRQKALNALGPPAKAVTILSKL